MSQHYYSCSMRNASLPIRSHQRFTHTSCLQYFYVGVSIQTLGPSPPLPTRARRAPTFSEWVVSHHGFTELDGTILSNIRHCMLLLQISSLTPLCYFRRDGHEPLWPYYCDTDGQGGISFLIKRFISSLITGWIPALLNAIWFGMLVPLVSYICIQVSGLCIIGLYFLNDALRDPAFTWALLCF